MRELDRHPSWEANQNPSCKNVVDISCERQQQSKLKARKPMKQAMYESETVKLGHSPQKLLKHERSKARMDHEALYDTTMNKPAPKPNKKYARQQAYSFCREAISSDGCFYLYLAHLCCGWCGKLEIGSAIVGGIPLAPGMASGTFDGALNDPIVVPMDKSFGRGTDSPHIPQPPGASLQRDHAKGHGRI